MPEAGMEKTMDEILEQVQREYAEQAKEVRAQPYVDARDAAHDNSKRSPEGLPNWEKLTRNEIEQARQHVAREREALLNRHAANLKGSLSVSKDRPEKTPVFSDIMTRDTLAQFVGRLLRLPANGKPVSIIDLRLGSVTNTTAPLHRAMPA